MTESMKPLMQTSTDFCVKDLSGFGWQMPMREVSLQLLFAVWPFIFITLGAFFAAHDGCISHVMLTYGSVLQYVLNFPKGEKYLSVLKDAADPDAQAALEAERARLRVLVRQKIADNKMLSEVNEGVHSPMSQQLKQAFRVMHAPRLLLCFGHTRRGKNISYVSNVGEPCSSARQSFVVRQRDTIPSLKVCNAGHSGNVVYRHLCLADDTKI